MGFALATDATLKQKSPLTKFKPKLMAFRSFKPTTVLAYTGTFVLTVTMIVTGSQSQHATVADPKTESATISLVTEPARVDEATALRIASDLAAAANLPVATNIANMSTSVDVKAQLALTKEELISKPLLVRAEPYNRDTQTYTTKADDTVEMVARQYNISPDTVKWANNLTADTLEANTKLTILPLNGVLYTVKDGDTLESISQKYKADAQRVTTYNDLELSEVKSGQKLILPDAILPEEERPGYVAPVAPAAEEQIVTAATASVPSVPVLAQPRVDTSAGNMYAFGNCTSYAYERRLQLGRPIGSFWGNAATWNTFAMQQGFTVDKTPAAGAVYQMPAFVDAYTGGYGHVGIVESVNADGSVNVSEMNYAGGFNMVSYRTIPASQAALYNYIH
jgi:surface antigen